MNPNLYAAFVLAAIVLIVIPGPTVLMLTSKSLNRGLRAGLMAVAGSFAATIVQLTVVVLGLASIVAFVGTWFAWIRGFGAVYLVYLGLRTLTKRRPVSAAAPESAAPSVSYRDFVEGFVVTLTNPKTLLFLGAFLPQFVDPALPAMPQLLALAASFLVIALVLDSGWAGLGARAGRFIAAANARGLGERISGGILIGAGAVLAMVRRA
jgi:threonine/homoserine/homoserine lactone efflux protein